MYSSEDFENFYVRYKAEGLPSGMSIQSWCMKNILVRHDRNRKDKLLDLLFNNNERLMWELSGLFCPSTWTKG